MMDRRAFVRFLFCSYVALSAHFAVADQHQAAQSTLDAPQTVSMQLAVAAAPLAAASVTGFTSEKMQLLRVSKKSSNATVSLSNTILPTQVLDPEKSKIQILMNRPLSDEETGGLTSIVSEPTVAKRRNEIFVTGNNFASYSKDYGRHFCYLDPYQQFPPAATGEFWGDQVSLYDRKHDTLFWILQYKGDGKTNRNGNVMRLTVARGKDIFCSWRYYDLTPSMVLGASGELFDYPNLEVSDHFLYVTMFTMTEDPVTKEHIYTSSVILRLPLKELSSYREMKVQYYKSTENTFRVAQGSQSIAYWGSNIDEETIRIFAWPENSTTISSQDMRVDRWIWPHPAGTWLDNVDSSITAAWTHGNILGFAWTAFPDQTLKNYHVRALLIDLQDPSKIVQPHLWSPSTSFSYPVVAVNSKGVVGISLMYGNASGIPGHAVGLLMPPQGGEPWKWILTKTAEGTHSPDQNYWGDFLSIKPDGKRPDWWVATGYILSGGQTGGDVQIRYIQFRRHP